MIIERMYIEGNIPNKTFTDGRHDVEVVSQDDLDTEIDRVETVIEAVDALKMDAYNISTTETKTGYTFNGKDVYVRNVTHDDFIDETLVIEGVTIIDVKGLVTDATDVSYPADSQNIYVRQTVINAEIDNVGSWPACNLFIYYTKNEEV